jgi:tetratricopeptide (TPR) repeat protein
VLAVEIRVLGEVTLYGPHGPVVLRRIGERIVLAVLAVHANEPVESTTLLRLLGEGGVDQIEVRTLVDYVTAVRAALQVAGGDRAVLPDARRRRGTYQLNIEPDLVDYLRFRAHAETGRAHAAGGEHQAAADAFQLAMCEWRGQPFAGIDRAPIDGLCQELEEQHRAVVRGLLTGQLHLGQHADVVRVARRMVGDYPTDDMVILAVHALARDGRRAEIPDFCAFATHRLRALLDDTDAALGHEVQVLVEALVRRPRESLERLPARSVQFGAAAGPVGPGSDENAVRSGLLPHTAALIEGIGPSQADIGADGGIPTYDPYRHATTDSNGIVDQRPRNYLAQTANVRPYAVDDSMAVPPLLTPDLRRLLIAQADDAGKHQYQFFDGHVPAAGKIYVEQRVENSAAPLVVGEAGIPGLLTVREVLTHPTEFANVLLVGGPGMGKSTVISQIVREQAEWWLAGRAAPDVVEAPYGNVVPVALPARLLVGRSLPTALSDICHQGGAGLANRILEEAPAPGMSWLVLVDGVDEVLRSFERSEVINVLANWLSRSDSPHRFLITTRPLSYGELPELRSQRVGEFSLQPFGPSDVRQFATNLFTARLGTSHRNEAVRSANLFEHRVTSARLHPVVNVPLMATIAALVFESDRDGELPTSRAGLYEKFVEHLLYGRRATLEQRGWLRREFQLYGVGEHAFEWLVGKVRHIVEHLADWQLSGHGGALLPEASRWVARECPTRFTSMPGWRQSLQGLLASSGVLTPDSGDLVFTHRSLAEYLAAGPRAAALDVPNWLAQARAPDTRNLALFVLARSLEPAEPLVRTLLDSQGEDVVVAGDVVADGIDIGQALRRRVIDRLFDQLEAEDPTAPDALRVLATLATDQAVGDRLRGLIDDDHARPWVRLLVADVLGVGGLRRLVETVSLEPAALRWANQQLIRRGETPLLQTGGDEDASGTAEDLGRPPELPGPLARYAYREALTSTRRGSLAFLALALALADAGDPAGLEPLQDCVTDLRLRIDLRLQAARALLKVDPSRAAILERIATDRRADSLTRTPVAVALAEVNDKAGRGALVELMSADPTIEETLPAAGLARAAIVLTIDEQDPRRTRIVTSAAFRDSETLRFWSGVPGRSQHFTGREDLLDQLHRALATRSAASNRPVTLHGVGGVGKTQLVLEYVYRYGDRYDFVWWIRAEQPSEVRASLESFAKQLGPPASNSHRQTTLAVHPTSEDSRRRWLLVFDSADEPDEISPLIPSAEEPAGHVIVTSRNQSWAQVSEAIEVDVFNRDESVELLRKRAEGSTDTDADRLAEKLDDLPLAVSQAVSVLSTTEMPISEYLQLFDAHLQGLTSEGRPTGYPTSVAVSVILATDRLRAEAPAAAQLLEMFAFFGPAPISVNLLSRGRDAATSEPLSQALRDRIHVNRAIRELRRYGLAGSDPGPATQVYRFVQLVLRESFREEEARQGLSNAQNLLASANPGMPDNPMHWPAHAEISPHVLPARLVEAEQVKARLVVLDQLRYRCVIGDYESARELGEIAVSAWQRATGEGLGPDGEQTLIATRHLADALRALGDYQRARRLTNQAYDRFRSRPEFGPHHNHSLLTAIGIGQDLRLTGRYREALAADQATLVGHRRAFRSHDVRTLRAMHMVAVDHQMLGDFTAAYEIDQDLVRVWHQRVGEHDPQTLLTVINLARDLYGLGRYPEALESAQRALLSCRDQLGSRHTFVLSGARTTCIALRKTGRYADALRPALDHHRDCHTRFGPDHELTLAATMSHANTLRAIGKLSEAHAVAAATVARYQRTFGDRHPLTLAATTNLAIILRASNKMREARLLDETTLSAARDTLGPDHDYALCAASNLTNDLFLDGEFANARALSETTLAISRQVRGDGHPYTLACAVNTALDMQATGDEEIGRELLDHSLAGLARTLGPVHPETIDARQGKRAECDIEPPTT